VRISAGLLLPIALFALHGRAQNRPIPGHASKSRGATQECARALRDPSDSLWTQRAPDVYRLRIETTRGDFVLEVSRSLAPRGADRFYHLAECGFYDHSRFYRVIAGRFVQFGIAGDPLITQIWRNARFPDDPVRASNVRGTFAFAMTGPNARTTQIYINTGDQSPLDAMGFAPFGKVLEGMGVVDKLYSGYGERSGGGMRAGHQGKLFEEGNAYVDREFPRLDKLIHAIILERPQLQSVTAGSNLRTARACKSRATKVVTPQSYPSSTARSGQTRWSARWIESGRGSPLRYSFRVRLQRRPARKARNNRLPRVSRL
jgi:peptidyl-prolyl cis-trans isomerase A (cyclophilin A)